MYVMYVSKHLFMSGNLCLQSTAVLCTSIFYLLYFLKLKHERTVRPHPHHHRINVYEQWHRPTRPPTRHGRCCYPNIKNTRLQPQSQLRFGQNGFTNQIKIMQCLLKVAAAARRPRQCFFVKEWLWRWWWRGWSWQWWWWQ